MTLQEKVDFLRLLTDVLLTCADTHHSVILTVEEGCQI